MSTKQSFLLFLAVAFSSIFAVWMTRRDRQNAPTSEPAVISHIDTRPTIPPTEPQLVPSPKPQQAKPDNLTTGKHTNTSQGGSGSRPAEIPMSSSGKKIPVGNSNPSPLENRPHKDTADIQKFSPSVLPAIQLSEDFKLPIVDLALAEGSLNERSPQVQAAATNLKTLFYRELAEAVAKNPELRKNTVTDPESGEETVIIEPGPEVEAIKAKSNERFRALFGDEKYNAYSMRTAMERLAPKVTSE